MACHPMKQLLGVTNPCEKATTIFYHIALVPCTTSTMLQIACRRIGGTDPQVCQHDSRSIVAKCQIAERLIRDTGRIPPPVDDAPSGVHEPREFNADNPATIRLAFASHLSRTAPFSARMDEIDPVGVNGSQERRSGQKVCP